MLLVGLAAVRGPSGNEVGPGLDFHEIRCQFAIRPEQAGASPGIVQQKTRHSTPKRTGGSKRPRDQESEAATATLPDLGAKRKGQGDVSPAADGARETHA